ncbi:hypothetical protein E2C01_029853 [Portunus trituberculatus]|uniref:Uncharacterized protein n=1 Tax=Portunus trituberculatus TaxID=210409 RepID=A0A5B7ETC0_PORTR|nr:hypothetical protein [Portunus trituberculatus]
MAAALVPEVKVIADDDGDEEATRYLDPSLGSTGGGRGPLLAPPPRFHPEDEEDDPGWLDLTDGTAFVECPDLLHTYTSLRPRPSYRDLRRAFSSRPPLSNLTQTKTLPQQCWPLQCQLVDIPFNSQCF